MAAKRIAVYPGTFDPPTLGHVDIIRRSLAVFDQVIVAVTDNPGKTPLLPVNDRVALLQEALKEFDGVSVERYNGLTVDFAKRCGAHALLRGMRTLGDFDYESHLALTNRTMTGIETVFILAGERYGFISSTLVREIARMGGDVSAMVPPCVLTAITRKVSGIREA